MARPAGVPARVMAVAACAAVFASGCTMCPDPFDYSGPVPNGSPPQNDFRARSNGILPLGAAPKPWPPIVKMEPENDPPPGSDIVGDGDDVPGTVPAGVMTVSEGEADPEPALVISPVAENDAAAESEPSSAADGTDSPEPTASARPTPKAGRRGQPIFREASRWLRWQ